MSEKNIVISGAAGFIGMHLSISLLEDGYNIFGIDNLNDYYDRSLKKSRLNKLYKYSNFSFSEIDIEDFEKLKSVFKIHKPTKVVNLAAQVGVRLVLKIHMLILILILLDLQI